MELKLREKREKEEEEGAEGGRGGGGDLELEPEDAPLSVGDLGCCLNDSVFCSLLHVPDILLLLALSIEREREI